MRVEEIKTPDRIHPKDRDVLAGVLYKAAGANQVFPEMSSLRLMGADIIGVRYYWPSSEQKGAVELRSGDQVVSVSWVQDGFLEVRVSDPTLECLLALSGQLHNFRLRIDGKYFMSEVVGLSL
jgi:hypothetical protein